MYIIKHIKDENATLQEGLILVGFFGVFILLSSMFRNYYVFNGFCMGLRGRKVLVSAMFNKIGKLSMKSLSRTNSGKLVTLISADILGLERGMINLPSFFSALGVNITCYFLIGFLFKDWMYVAIIVGVWVVMVGLQVLTARKLKPLQLAQSGKNDQRMKLVNDMVTGIRTIKSYGWENHYLSKILKIRKEQEVSVFKMNIISSMGLSIF